ncbi:MAG: hypothetical protein ACLSB9_28605 [Hydrogeniiclostridium mannosilyticum]
MRNIYEESHGLGVDKILSALNTHYHTSKKMVRELMKEMGLQSFRKIEERLKDWRKLHEFNNAETEFSAKAPNLLGRRLTQFTYQHKTYYLCAILDLFSRK